MKLKSTPSQLVRLVGAALFPYVILGLVSCESGPGSSSTITPQSLNGISLDILSLQGPTFEFIAGRQQTSSGVEEGSIVQYTQNSNADGFLFPGTDFFFGGLLQTVVDEQPVKWPDEFNNAQYRYTPVGEASGRLEIFGTGVSTVLTTIDIDGNDNFFFTFVTAVNFLQNVTSADPVTFDILFNASGSTIEGIDLVMTTPQTAAAGLEFTGIEEQELSLNGDITFTNGGRVSIGFDPDLEDLPSQLFDGELDGQNLTLTDDLTGTRSIYQFTTASLGQGFDSDVTDSGRLTLTFDLNGDPALANTISDGTYEVTPVEDTDNFLLDIEFESSATLTNGDIQDGDITLNFSNQTYTRPSLDLVTGAQVPVTGSFTIN